MADGFSRYAFDTIKAKGLKYSAVSVVNVIVGQGLLFFFTLVVFKTNDIAEESRKAGLDTLSNVLAVCISAVPSFYLNRAWVWGKSGKSHFKSEILPFFVFITIGLIFSTLTVFVASGLAHDRLTGTLAKIVPNAANLGAFGILWVLKFFLLDKLFHVGHDAHEAELDAAGEAGVAAETGRAD